MEQATIPHLSLSPGPASLPEPAISLIRVTDADQSFLVGLFIDARASELALLSLDVADTRVLVDLQLGAQRARLRAMHPGAEDLVVWSDGSPVGRCCVERSGRQHRLLDLVVHSRSRRRRIASQVLRHLQSSARDHGVPLRSRVPAADEAARGLLTGAGFAACGEADGWVDLVWLCPDVVSLDAGGPQLPRIVTLPH